MMCLTSMLVDNDALVGDRTNKLPDEQHTVATNH